MIPFFFYIYDNTFSIGKGAEDSRTVSTNSSYKSCLSQIEDVTKLNSSRDEYFWDDFGLRIPSKGIENDDLSPYSFATVEEDPLITEIEVDENLFVSPFKEKSLTIYFFACKSKKNKNVN